jgi:uncharacterized protein (TIGR02147 family)
MTPAQPASATFSIFDYFDYRRCLDEYYRHRKSLNSRFSHRSFALKAGYKSSGLYIQLVKGKLNLTKKMLPGFIKAMGLEENEGEYFGHMVNFTHAQNSVARQHWFDRMVPMLPPRTKAVALDQKKYYENWYHVAVREALAILEIGDDHAALADFIRPSITPAQALYAMELLDNLGLIRKDAKGHWRANDAIVESTPDLGPMIIHAYQESLIDLGKAALKQYGRDERNIACFTFSLSDEGHKRLSLKVDQFFREVSELVRSDTGMNRICQLNVQYFPMSRAPGK